MLCAGAHAGGRAAAQADQHARPAELHQRRAGGERQLMHLRRAMLPTPPASMIGL